MLIIIGIFALITAISVLAAKAQTKRAKKAEENLINLQKAYTQVREKAERLQKALNKNKKIEEEANAERKELAQTLDSDLVKRANSLFS
jgi:type II secretory pathway pseudopilin PulG